MFHKFLNSLKTPNNASLIEAIQKGYQTCFESYTPEIAQVKSYIEADHFDILVDDYAYLVLSFLEDNYYELFMEIPEEYSEEYDMVQWLKINHPQEYNEFIKLVTKIATSEGHSKIQFSKDTKVVLNEWLIHFSNNAQAIAKEGFTYGIDDLEKLGFSTRYKQETKKGGRLGFAYQVKDFIKYYQNELGNKYGDSAVLFKASGVRVHSRADEEPQVIFDISTVKNIILMEKDDNGNPVILSNDGKVLHSSNPDLSSKQNFEKTAHWVVNNFEQYRKAYRK